MTDIERKRMRALLMERLDILVSVQPDDFLHRALLKSYEVPPALPGDMQALLDRLG